MNMVQEYESLQRRYSDLKSAIPLMKRMRDAMAEVDTCSAGDYDYCLYRIKRLVEEADAFLKKVEKNNE